MERDIEKYTQDYLAGLKNDFEEVMVKFRRKKVLEIMNAYRPRNILEIGCGMDSISKYYTDYESCVVIEPSKHFCNSIVGGEYLCR